jgi:hypothetical protein
MSVWYLVSRQQLHGANAVSTNGGKKIKWPPGSSVKAVLDTLANRLTVRKQVVEIEFDWRSFDRQIIKCKWQGK